MHKLERKKMGAPTSSGGKSMRACGNRGGNLQWRRNEFPLRPTCHVNFEFLRLLMIPPPPFMSLNLATFPYFCTVQ